MVMIEVMVNEDLGVKNENTPFKNIKLINTVELCIFIGISTK